MFCYVPATSAAYSRLLFFLFLLRPLTVLMKQTRQAVRAVKPSIFLRCLWLTQTGIYQQKQELSTDIICSWSIPLKIYLNLKTG
jgi:hypothetical protein